MPRTLKAVIFAILLTSLTGCSKNAEGEIILKGSEEVPRSTEDALAEQAGATGEMVLIPAGEFMMGSPSGEGTPYEYPQHRVYVDAFYMDKYEVTNAQYKRFIEATGHRPLPKWVVLKYSPGDNHPVMGVSWDDATSYARWAGKRLPTEAEWEYACRAGTTTKYNFGDSISRDNANYCPPSGKAVTWCDHGTAQVGSFAANAYGLYDMHGNVCEWCSDWYNEEYYANSPTRNPKGPTNGRGRAIRGGGWDENPASLRSACRPFCSPDATYNNLGFRCARDPEQQ